MRGCLGTEVDNFRKLDSPGEDTGGPHIVEVLLREIIQPAEQSILLLNANGPE